MPGVKLFGPGGFFGPREIIPNPEFHTPPKPAETAYGPKHVRNTDEWGLIIHTNEDGTLRPEYVAMDDRDAEEIKRSMGKPQSVGDLDHIAYMPPPPPRLPPLTTSEEIKLLARTLTYGEMMELVASIWHYSPEKSLTVDSAPAVLWTWATYVYPDPPA